MCYLSEASFDFSVVDFPLCWLHIGTHEVSMPFVLRLGYMRSNIVIFMCFTPPCYRHELSSIW